MTNSLGRDIENGELVVLGKENFKKDYQNLSKRIVVCLGGFGMRNETMGTAVYCKFLSDDEECRYEGYQIDPKETEELQELLASFVS